MLKRVVAIFDATQKVRKPRGTLALALPPPLASRSPRGFWGTVRAPTALSIHQTGFQD